MPSDDPTFKNKNGQRVVVTINGGGDVAGAGGGTNQISLSAGGTERNDRSRDRLRVVRPDADSSPHPLRRQLRNGHRHLRLDQPSRPIQHGHRSRRITSMIDTFAGTPVKFELTKFGWVGAVLGGGATGARYFDMLKEADVSDLKVYVNGGTTSTGRHPKIDSVNDATNYEDGLYRAFPQYRRNHPGQPALEGHLLHRRHSQLRPSRRRLGPARSTASPPVRLYADDTGLARRTARHTTPALVEPSQPIAREFGVQVDYIGVFVGADTTASAPTGPISMPATT